MKRKRIVLGVLSLAIAVAGCVAFEPAAAAPVVSDQNISVAPASSSVSADSSTHGVAGTAAGAPVVDVASAQNK